MTLFTPFYPPATEPKPAEDIPASEDREEIESLQAEVERLQQQLATLRAKPKRGE
jgi:polyhydroxyalkanoate synthesis regulator phasin